ncbi:70 kDa peptidyl-prolyl isomerase-like [Chenopodium quinoa]|uniref:70 kDa peptidyl-prolyl isomerase-like n=1 Tax=Chenopodium quinoa TaxID=63459 RepID=UPI000B78FAA6|nr:70 kDa peptidyl-prolyl isomerase-like [Chenopodium quinoa]
MGIHSSKGEVSNAFDTYSKAIKCLCVTLSTIYDDVLATNINLDHRDIIISLHLNIAACEIKINKLSKAIVSCSVVLMVDKRNVKAVFRRGLALVKSRSLEKAYIDLLEAREIEPKNKEILQEIKSVENILFGELRDGDVDLGKNRHVNVHLGDEVQRLKGRYQPLPKRQVVQKLILVVICNL